MLATSDIRSKTSTLLIIKMLKMPGKFFLREQEENEHSWEHCPFRLMAKLMTIFSLYWFWTGNKPTPCPTGGVAENQTPVGSGTHKYYNFFWEEIIVFLFLREDGEHLETLPFSLYLFPFFGFSRGTEPVPWCKKQSAIFPPWDLCLLRKHLMAHVVCLSRSRTHSSFFYLREHFRFSIYLYKIASHCMTYEKAEVMKTVISSLNVSALERNFRHFSSPDGSLLLFSYSIKVRDIHTCEGMQEPLRVDRHPQRYRLFTLPQCKVVERTFLSSAVKTLSKCCK